MSVTPPSAQNFLAGCALVLIGSLGLIMTMHVVPAANHDYLIFILGALSGAITTSGARQAVNALTTNGENTTVTPPATTKSDET